MIGPYYIMNQTQRFAAWGKPGTASKGGGVVLVDIVLDGRTLKVEKEAYNEFAAFEAIRDAHDHHMTGTDVGFYSYRHMRHDPSLPWSVHAWARALDWDWLQNPAGSKLVTNIPREMRNDLLALRYNSGARVFLWGGDWDWDGQSSDHTYIDAMHWEAVGHPLDAATGIKGFTPTKPVAPATDWTKELIVALPTLKKGDGFKNKNPHLRDDVRRMQACMAIGGVMAVNTFNPKNGMPDGLFGDGSFNGLVSYQGKNGLKKDGICGPATWTKLLGE